MKALISFGAYDQLSLDVDSIESVEGLADLRGGVPAKGKDGEVRWTSTMITMKTGVTHQVSESKPEVDRRIQEAFGAINQA